MLSSLESADISFPITLSSVHLLDVGSDNFNLCNLGVMGPDSTHCAS